MLDALQQTDTNWFLWVNSHHTTALDWVMWVLSQHWCFAAVLLLAFGLTTLRIEPRRWWLVLLAVGACFLLADQGSVHLFKNTVGRLRPCHALEDVRMFRTGCGGQYGFVSSHAANAFAIATFLWMRYRRNAKVTLALLAVWAFATCYSRAYLGKHYPGDLVCGALFGILVGLIVWWLATTIEKSCTKMKQNG
jgi:undecaprenyl-diphosphatase